MRKNTQKTFDKNGYRKFDVYCRKCGNSMMIPEKAKDAVCLLCGCRGGWSRDKKRYAIYGKISIIKDPFKGFNTLCGVCGKEIYNKTKDGYCSSCILKKRKYK